MVFHSSEKLYGTVFPQPSSTTNPDDPRSATERLQDLIATPTIAQPSPSSCSPTIYKLRTCCLCDFVPALSDEISRSGSLKWHGKKRKSKQSPFYKATKLQPNAEGNILLHRTRKYLFVEPFPYTTYSGHGGVNEEVINKIEPGLYELRYLLDFRKGRYNIITNTSFVFRYDPPDRYETRYRQPMICACQTRDLKIRMHKELLGKKLVRCLKRVCDVVRDGDERVVNNAIACLKRFEEDREYNGEILDVEVEYGESRKGDVLGLVNELSDISMRCSGSGEDEEEDDETTLLGQSKKYSMTERNVQFVLNVLEDLEIAIHASRTRRVETSTSPMVRVDTVRSQKSDVQPLDSAIAVTPLPVTTSPASSASALILTKPTLKSKRPSFWDEDDLILVEEIDGFAIVA